jgi:hypothetical protein
VRHHPSLRINSAELIQHPFNVFIGMSFLFFFMLSQFSCALCIWLITHVSIQLELWKGIYLLEIVVCDAISSHSHSLLYSTKVLLYVVSILLLSCLNYDLSSTINIFQSISGPTCGFTIIFFVTIFVT